VARDSGAVRRAIPLLMAAALLALAGCGQSSSDKAKKQVCDARADLSKQVDKLTSMTPQTGSLSAIQDGLAAIQTDLKKIRDVQGDLNQGRKAQVQQATQEFQSQLNSIVSGATSNLTLSNAATQLQAAAQQLATSYKQTLAKVDCS
jgi:capsule polysaccharide export protein KpsE/RkpR